MKLNLLRTDPSNAFAHYTMKIRVPAIIREIYQRSPDYPPTARAELDRLADELATDAPIRPPNPPNPNFADWNRLYPAHSAETWLHSTWFFAEVYLYYLVVLMTGWDKTNLDPFAPIKEEEIASAALWERLDLALATRDLPAGERLRVSIHHALWGNRADLSYALAASHGAAVHDNDLILDDTAAVVPHLLATHGPVHLVHDNAGTELATDLALIDTLLALDPERRVISHVKAHPTYVSDAVREDVSILLAQMHSGKHGVEARALASRLGSNPRWEVRPDYFWNGGRFIFELSDRLAHSFDGAALVIFKGDLNYRRISGDTIWNTVPFAEVLREFPHPTLVLRTLKSDVIAGLAPGQAEALDATDPQWRINGKRGIIQFKA